MRTILSRTFALVVTLALAASAHAAPIFTEDFESFSEGAITTAVSDSFTITNGFNNRTDFWAVEGPGSNPAGTGNNGGDLFGTGNTRGFGLRDLDDSNNPGPPNYITFDPIATTGLSGFSFSFDVTNDVGSGNTTSADELRVIFDLDYDGSTFDADETYTLTGNGSGALTDGTTAAVEGSFRNFSHALASDPTGALGVRIEAVSFTGGGDQVTFDNVQVSAIPEPASLVLLAAGGLLMLPRRRGRTV